MLDPCWTAYDKEILYAVHDVTPMVKNGANVLGIMLGNGWYNPAPLRFWGKINLRNALSIGRPKVKAMLRLTYSDGGVEVIATDENWDTAPGPIVRNNVYPGEQYDARLFRENWSNPKGDLSASKKAVPTRGPAGKLVAQQQPPVRITDTIKPIGITELKPGVFVFDMGKNFAGVAQIKVSGNAGTTIRLRYGEDKYADGSINLMTAVAGQIKNSNGGPGAPAVAWQEDSYILNGRGAETRHPRFTFHGFRYVEVTGWPGKPTLNDVVGVRLHSDLATNGTFTTDNEMFNQLNGVIRNTFLSNVFSVQSDCPAREKFGYGGDLFCTAEAFMYNFDMSNFYSKVLRDFANDQRPSGGITETAPFVGIADSGPGEGSGPLAFRAVFPYPVKKMYDFYGDQRIIEENYPALKKHIEFLRSKAKDNLFDKEDLGDHEALTAKSIPLTPSVFYYLQVRIMAQFASILQFENDRLTYSKLADEIRTAINKNLIRKAMENLRWGPKLHRPSVYGQGFPKSRKRKKLWHY
ncbi:family 78 glycoside hydrolase catalytic domain [Mucilaginibacter sp. S1162]|uniref:alpha-L-rhamnosidase n=1 Tax=Mucilaginibacter humi TaxID=2732510 RepID=A0ABX1W288_9SPHI|nr:family 78 glycoside hydrolase catalytic domain [Mucilaginibacter humi]NNU34346.1 family 78 glycoside hydrolase catalytic domain [Mucilaginibacter humi]